MEKRLNFRRKTQFLSKSKNGVNKQKLVVKGKQDILEKLKRFNSRLDRKFKENSNPILKNEIFGSKNEGKRNRSKKNGYESDFNSQFKGYLNYKERKEKKNIFIKAGKDHSYVCKS